MKTYAYKLIATLVAIIVIIFSFNSCKKTNDIKTDNNLTVEQQKAKIIEATKQRYGNITAPFILNANQPATSVSYKNQQGQLIQFAGGALRTAATCGQYTCSTAPSASDLFVSYTLLYSEWFYTCGGGHNLTAVWKVSTPYTVLTENPNTDDPSYGNIRIKNSGGTVLVTSSDLGANNLTITSLGADPNCSANTLYRVSYKWSGISDSYFPGNYVECSLNLYNNCSLTSNVNVVGFTGTFPGPSSILDPFTHPCDRVDKAFVNPPGGGTSYATIAGGYVVCSPPSGFTAITNHQVEYRPVTNTSSDLWEDQPISGGSASIIYLGIIPGTGTPGITSQTMNPWSDVLNLTNMTSSSGKWIVRYRNIYTSGCSSTYSPNAAWSGNWRQEIWNL